MSWLLQENPRRPKEGLGEETIGAKELDELLKLQNPTIQINSTRGSPSASLNVMRKKEMEKKREKEEKRQRKQEGVKVWVGQSIIDLNKNDPESESPGQPLRNVMTR